MSSRSARTRVPREERTSEEVLRDSSSLDVREMFWLVHQHPSVDGDVLGVSLKREEGRERTRGRSSQQLALPPSSFLSSFPGGFVSPVPSYSLPRTIEEIKTRLTPP